MASYQTVAKAVVTTQSPGQPVVYRESDSVTENQQFDIKWEKMNSGEWDSTRRGGRSKRGLTYPPLPEQLGIHLTDDGRPFNEDFQMNNGDINTRIRRREELVGLRQNLETNCGRQVQPQYLLPQMQSDQFSTRTSFSTSHKLSEVYKWEAWIKGYPFQNQGILF